MSARDVSTRRSRRTPTTPSRYSKDFILESAIVIKKEVKDTTNTPNRSPRRIKTSDHTEYAKRSKKSTSPRQTTEMATMMTRRGSIKRLADVKCELTEEVGLSKTKRKKPSEVEDKRVDTPGVEETEETIVYELTVQDNMVQDSRDEMSDCSSNAESEPNSDSDKHPEAVVLLLAASLSPSVSHSKDRESEVMSQTQPPATKELASSQEQARKVTSTSSVLKSSKEAAVMNKSLPGESGSKDSPPVDTSPGKSTTEVKSLGESGSKDSPPVDTSPGKSTTEVKSLESTKSKDASVPVSPKAASPVKMFQVVNVIRSDQARHIGLLAEQSHKKRTDVKNAIQVVSSSSSRGKVASTLVTADMLSKIKLNGRTVATQTTATDMQVLMYMSKNIITSCAHKILTVSPSKVLKPHRITNNSKLMKHCQTDSTFSDINFTILEAVGKDDGMVNELSLSYAGEETCDVDKKIQWMLFGQDLITAMTDNSGRVPSIVVDRAQVEGKSKPKNATISIESWSLALTVLNPNV